MFLKTSHESIICRYEGDALLQTVTDEIELQIEDFLEVMDRYRQAALLASSGEQKDLENEAIALTKLAYIYSRAVADGKKKAHELYKYTLTLAEALKPRDLTQTDWYLAAELFIKEYRLSKDVSAQLELEKKKQRKSLNLN